MIFNSFAFALVFLPATLAASSIAGRSRRLRTLILLVASLIFYAFASLSTLPVLALSLALNSLFVRRVSWGSPLARRRWLMTALVSNVALLATCKYARFAVENLNALGTHLPLPAFALPLGISFFTLQQVVYVIDCYEDLESPAPLVEHALFISFFPYISAGPITRARDVLPALDPRAQQASLDVGLSRFILGLAKKVAIADPCGRLVDAVFGGGAGVGAIEAWVAAVAFTIQLYFDFSGYSDMAIGIGRMLGFALPENFDSPLKARSIVEFWTRWHITLSKFITTYLYTPLLKSSGRVTFPKAMICTLIAMTIAGLWHGPAWTFVVFGAAHGTALVINQIWRKRKKKLPAWAARALTLGFVVVAFVPFRARTLSEASSLLASMVGLHGRGTLGGVLAASGRIDEAVSLFCLLCGLALSFGEHNTGALAQRFKPTMRWVVVCSILSALSLLLMNSAAAKGFIYRDF